MNEFIKALTDGWKSEIDKICQKYEIKSEIETS